jgi:hypothetical protein
MKAAVAHSNLAVASNCSDPLDDAWCGFPVQSDYVVALAGESGFAIMIGDADGPASITTSPASCYSSYLVLAADLNNDNHIGANCNSYI